MVDGILSIMVRHLKVGSDEHVEISALTFKKTKPSKEGFIRDHILQYDNNPW